MRLRFLIPLILCVAFTLRAEEPWPRPEAEARAAAPKLKAPSNLKFNSTTGTSKAFAPAPTGQALTADGTGFKSIWAFVKGTDIDSSVAGSPAANGLVLTADGSGKANWNQPTIGSNLTLGGTTTGTFSGNGAGLTGVTATIPDGSITNAKLANSSLTVTAGTGLTGGGLVPLGGATTLSLGSDLTLGGTTTGTFSGNGAGLTGVTANIADGSVTNAKLANSGITVTAGSGLGGGGAVSLGGTVALTNAGVISLTGGGGITVNAATGAIILGSNATSANAANTLVLRDGSGSFSSGNITAAGTFNLPATSGASTGLITQNGTRLIHTFGAQNFFAGIEAGNFTMTGAANTASGFQALTLNTTGSNNTASGDQALFSNTKGNFNTATGNLALANNTTASRNVAVGNFSLLSQSFNNGDTAWNSDNVAVGFEALFSNQPTTVFTGYDNTALGTQAMRSNTTGSQNTASGFQALFTNSTGLRNTAGGFKALNFNSSGNDNTAHGYLALQNSTGSGNTAVGLSSLINNITGNNNTAIGYIANVASGNLTNATAIGAFANVNASNKVRIGDTAVTVIEGQVAFTFTSDRNAKENFLPVDGAEVLRKIRELPVTSWNYIGKDEKPIRHYGPMAQDFHEAFGHDALGTIGTPTTVNSGDMAGILISAVQKLSEENLEMRDENAALKKRLADQNVRLERIEKMMGDGQPKTDAALVEKE